MSENATPVVVKPGEDNHYTWGAVCDGWRLTSGPDLSVIEERMPPGATEKTHHHAKARQFFRVLKGMLSMELDSGVLTVRAGEGLEIPPGEVHRAFNEAKDVCVFLVVSTPTTQGDRIEAGWD